MAPTRIYTYGHTLSLHDALPICHRRSAAVRCVHWSRRAGGAEVTCHRSDPATSGQELYRRGVERNQHGHRQGCREAGRNFRSEEHTYELQYLMRTSYADFCLKKNKKINFILLIN